MSIASKIMVYPILFISHMAEQYIPGMDADTEFHLRSSLRAGAVP